MGISKEALDEKLAAANCKNRVCTLEGGTLNVTLTSDLSVPVVMKVQFEYSSGAQPEEMVASVSRQYGVTPKSSNLKREIARAKEGYLVQIPFFNTVTRAYGGRIAAWDLGPGLSLNLFIDHPGDLNKYSLVLKSEAIAKDDKTASKRKMDAEAARNRAVNPVPRF